MRRKSGSMRVFTGPNPLGMGSGVNFPFGPLTPSKRLSALSGHSLRMTSLRESISLCRPDICSCRDSRRNFFRNLLRFACLRFRSLLSTFCWSVRALEEGSFLSTIPSEEDSVVDGTGAGVRASSAFLLLAIVVVAAVAVAVAVDAGVVAAVAVAVAALVVAAAASPEKKLVLETNGRGGGGAEVVSVVDTAPSGAAGEKSPK
jgi:hypothetical protein